MSDLNFGGVWAATLASVRRNSELVVPVAAAFIFLPQLALQLATGDLPPDEWFTGIGSTIIIPVLLGVFIVSLIGQLVLTHIAVRDGTGTDRSLGGVISQCASLALPALAANLIQGIAVGFGFLLLIVPGLWLLARLLLVVPVIVAETRDPVEALKRSWQLTDGNGFRLIGMIIVLFLGFILISIGISGLGAAIGVITTVATGQSAESWGVGRWAFELLTAGVSTAISVFWVTFIAMLYTTLRAEPR